MLVPLDGSARSEAILGPATALAEVLKADLLLTRIVESHLGSQVEKEQALVREYLSATQVGLQAAGQTADTLTETGHPASAIADIAVRREADLIAMSTHGHGGLARLAFGSTATRILLRASVPLLLARPAALP
jgi:nucleotide-binding universal stress UspA family protein